MQVVKATDLFNNINIIDKTEFEESQNINLDFSDIKSIDINAITTLLNIQKVALLNNQTLSIINANSEIKNMLDVTGLNKTFDNISVTNPILRK